MTVHSVAIGNYQGCWTKGLLTQIMAVAVSPWPCDCDLGIWQPIYTYSWLPSSLRSCDCHLKTSLSQKINGQTTAACQEDSLSFLGSGWKQSQNSSRILAQNSCRMGCLQPAPRNEKRPIVYGGWLKKVHFEIQAGLVAPELKGPLGWGKPWCAAPVTHTHTQKCGLESLLMFY